MSTSPPLRRRFLPIPIETTYKTHRVLPIDSIDPSPHDTETTAEDPNPIIRVQLDGPPKRRFHPQPIETIRLSNRGGAVKQEQLCHNHSFPPIHDAPPFVEETPPRTKPRFAPQLIETTKRSKRSNNVRPTTSPAEKTDVTPNPNYTCLSAGRPKTKPDQHLLSPHDIRSSSLPPLRPYRQGSMRPHPNTRRSTRHNSYHPEIGSPLSDVNIYVMEEEADNAESTPSLTESFGSSEDSNLRLQMARTRESCDENYTGYLLSLAAVQAEEQLRERQLREQELAAYANSDVHNPVSHFYDLESDAGSEEDDGPILLPHEKVARRQSTVSGFTAVELHQHEEALALMRAEETFRMVAEEAAKPSFNDPFWTNGMNDKGILGAAGNDDELKLMREAASPPMLGGDLVFRMCPSPKFTKFETDQRIAAPPPKNGDGGGLWGGYCVAENDTQCIAPHHRGPALLETPDNEREDPFSTMTFPDGATSKPHPASSRGMHMLSGLDDRLKIEVAKAKLEEAILIEFNDTFVTQVYNYLSLGYPLLAREYDEELSHISHIPEEQLRIDDEVKVPVGNVGIKPGTGVTDATGGRGRRHTEVDGAEELYPRVGAPASESVHELGRTDSVGCESEEGELGDLELI